MRMKNKKAEQIASKQRHLEQRLADKARRRGEPMLTRPEPSRAAKPTILIVCEGENTEPGYFEKFRLSSAKIKAVGEGYNTVSLVRRALELKEEGNYEQVWCVFDKDDFSAQDFNEAVQLAHTSGFGLAYSNQAFEYWLILHFDDHQGGPMHRGLYGAKLNEHLEKLGCWYDAEGSKKITPEMFDHLMATDPKTGKRRIDLAIGRAARIYDNYDHRSPAMEESSTTVFGLVSEILKYM